jgi:hypothetical protein
VSPVFVQRSAPTGGAGAASAVGGVTAGAMPWIATPSALLAERPS